MRPLQGLAKRTQRSQASSSLDLKQVWLQTEPFQSYNYKRPREAAPPSQVLFTDLPLTLEAEL